MPNMYLTKSLCQLTLNLTHSDGNSRKIYGVKYL